MYWRSYTFGGFRKVVPTKERRVFVWVVISTVTPVRPRNVTKLKKGVRKQDGLWLILSSGLRPFVLTWEDDQRPEIGKGNRRYLYTPVVLPRSESYYPSYYRMTLQSKIRDLRHLQWKIPFTEKRLHLIRLLICTLLVEPNGRTRDLR